ncbi:MULTISPECIES: hypothetical protein [Streptomyces]|jgi:hypothetical protein|uniref:Secreted protein n=1 Tax=Streptomyces spinosisporus TaxID=2927582 RepID=A0ABS9X999_9ACTN|nr:MULTISPECIES: hypothetical protein [Streptomyces]EPD67465.1 hypothetical protein HMPREF1211_01724 [Streptomyces sp. HGB0020]MCI3238640.1 hypothetical protein [Streptomyces spinosisporus]WUB34969.1 hypothetical protein OHN38_08640 [Streptomyces sp. NBC_00588]
MALLAVIIPILMLGVVLALGRYEELLLPRGPDDGDRDALQPPGPVAPAVTSRGGAETPAPLP